ncbi:MAG: T9SS type A sorting domain-containing protein [bacterium]
MKMDNSVNKTCEKAFIRKWLLCLSFLPSLCFSQVVNGSFEMNGHPSLDNWVIRCNDGESFQDAPGGGGMWSLRFLTGNLQGCFPRTAEQTIPGVSNGDIVEVRVWARQDEQKLSQTSVYLKIFHADKTTILSVDTTTSKEWTQLIVTDTLFLAEGDSVAIVLDSGLTSGPDILDGYSYFDLVEEQKTGQILVSVDDAADLPIKDFKLFQNFPNPFNPATTISYHLPKDARVNLIIYNLLGERVRTLVNQTQTAGERLVVWDGKDDLGQIVNSGLYIYRLETEGTVINRKMLFLK